MPAQLDFTASCSPQLALKAGYMMLDACNCEIDLPKEQGLREMFGNVLLDNI
jgi:hypothetical protein